MLPGASPINSATPEPNQLGFVVTSTELIAACEPKHAAEPEGE
jgi:hypothetical protein